MKVIVDHDAIPFKEAGYKCEEQWAFTDAKTKNTNRWHLCIRWTENFMEPTILKDIRFFEFNPHMGKCTNHILTTYIDGKKYTCDCDLNFNTISDTKKQGDTYLCVSRKIDIVHYPITPNHPEVTTGPKAKKS